MPNRPHTARIIAIGDELLLGKIVDTNSSWLASQLVDEGFVVDSIRIIDDDEPCIVDAMLSAAADAELVLVTGGLGPTDDDRTRHALAAAMERPLVEHASAWKQVTAYHKKIGRHGRIATSNRRQALVPQGAKILRNDRGTAPGLLAKVHGAWIACMPGVPHEMKAMAERLWAKLPQLFTDLKQPHIAEMHVAGVGESRLQDQLGALADSKIPRVGITAREAGHITIRIVGSATAVTRHAAKVRRRVKEWLLPAAGLEASLLHELSQRSLTITTAESCTCGHVVARIGALPGASEILREGCIAYHNAVKEARLQVSSADLKRHGAVSKPVVEAMAVGALQSAGADVAIATSGLAGPGGATRTKPVGTVWVAVATADGVRSHLHQLRGSRERIQARAASQALLLAWEVISGRAGVGV